MNNLQNKSGSNIHRKRTKVLFAAHCSLLIVFFLSCRSAPRQFDALLEHTHIPLDPGASVYLLANVKQARPIIEILPVPELQDSQTVQMLDRTNFVAAALFPYESGRHFQLAAWGKYPSSRASMALGSNRHWYKQTSESGDTFWHAENARLSMSIRPKQAFAISSYTREPVNPQAVPPGVEIPQGFNDFARSVPLSLWMNNAGLVLQNIINNAGVPIRLPAQQLFVNIYPMPESEFDILIRLVFANATQARGAVSMLNLAASFVPEGLEIAAIFLANPPILNGSNIDIKTARLTENDLKFLFGLLFRNR